MSAEEFEGEREFQRQLAEGTRSIGGYLIVAPLGYGGQARVYEARSPDGYTIALKVRDGARDRLDPTGRHRYDREVRSLKGVIHPGVVRVLDHGRDGDADFIAMEFVEDASDLRSLFPTDADRSCDVGHEERLRRRVGVIAKVADAVEAVHAARIVHRDIKPTNILVKTVVRNGDVHLDPVLIDFGLARGSESGQTVSSHAI